MPREKYTTSLDSDLLKWLKIQAIKEDKNVNDIIERLITEYKESQQKSPS